MAVDDGIGFLVRPRVRVSVGADDGMAVGGGSSLLAELRVGVFFGTDDDMAVGNGSGLVVGSSVGASLGTEDGVVLDPFFGSGTTAEVAMEQDKNWVGIELNEEFEKISQKRLKPTIVKKKTREKASEFWQ